MFSLSVYSDKHQQILPPCNIEQLFFSKFLAIYLKTEFISTDIHFTVSLLQTSINCKTSFNSKVNCTQLQSVLPPSQQLTDSFITKMTLPLKCNAATFKKQLRLLQTPMQPNTLREHHNTVSDMGSLLISNQRASPFHPF